MKTTLSRLVFRYTAKPHTTENFFPLVDLERIAAGFMFQRLMSVLVVTMMLSLLSCKKEREINGQSDPLVRVEKLATAPAEMVAAYGPTTMFNPGSNAVGQKVLYARAMQLNYSGINNGKMYATFEHLTTARSFPLYESIDGGANWTYLTEITDQVNGWGLRFQPHLYELPQQIGNMPAGTLLFASVSVPTSNTNTKIDIYKSNNLGRNWAFVSSVATGGGPSVGGTPIWEPFLMVANKKLICYYSDERDPAHNQKLVHQTSTNGVNWGALVNDVALGTTLRPGMAVVAKMGNGKYIMSFEVGELSTSFINNYKISDDAENWNPTDGGTTINGGGSPYIVALPSGKLVMNSHGSGSVFTNNTNGTGSWTAVATPYGSATGYSRALVPLQDGNLFIVSGGSFGGTTNTVTYASIEIGNYCKFINRATGRAIDNAGTPSNGSNVFQYNAAPSYNQHWLAENIGQGYLKFKGRNGGSYLDNLNVTADGGLIGQWAGGSSQNQHWTLVDAGNGYVKIVSRSNAKAIDTGGDNLNGSPLKMWTNGSSFNQQWIKQPVD